MTRQIGANHSEIKAALEEIGLSRRFRLGARFLVVGRALGVGGRARRSVAERQR